MKPSSLPAQIFVDSGFPEDTKKVIDLLGFLDGQTTNPSLVAKKLLANSKQPIANSTLSEEALLEKYKEIVHDISALIPQGSVSIEVYADKETPAEKMVEQARVMNAWIPNAHIKLPTTTEGLKAAEMLVTEKIRVNMTLVFSQEQAAAVHAATRGAKEGDVFVSPFIGRLDDRGENGMDLIKNIATMYKTANSHVLILAASLRTMNHFMGSISSGADILTCPLTIIEEWVQSGMHVPGEDYQYDAGSLTRIPYVELDLTRKWQSFTIRHDLTDAGLQKFADDWNGLIR